MIAQLSRWVGGFQLGLKVLLIAGNQIRPAANHRPVLRPSTDDCRLSCAGAGSKDCWLLACRAPIGMGSLSPLASDSRTAAAAWCTRGLGSLSAAALSARLPWSAAEWTERSFVLETSAPWWIARFLRVSHPFSLYCLSGTCYTSCWKWARPLRTQAWWSRTATTALKLYSEGGCLRGPAYVGSWAASLPVWPLSCYFWSCVPHPAQHKKSWCLAATVNILSLSRSLWWARRIHVPVLKGTLYLSLQAQLP